jgi:hypothetical protein
MKDDYRKKFEEFISEILKQDILEFGSPKKWKLSGEPLNGVDIGYEMPSKSSRALLHELGQKYGLIPLCPGDIVDLELTDDFSPKCMVVVSIYGRFMIKPKNSRDRNEMKLL